MATQSTAPAGYHTVQPYLIVKGARAAIDFYVRVFNATERMCMQDDSGRVVHAEIVIGDSAVMMADESPAVEAYSPAHYGGSPVTLMIYVADCDAAYARALEAGATSKREPADQPYGDRNAGFTDPFGHSWYLATHLRDVSPEEMEATMNVSIVKSSEGTMEAAPAPASPIEATSV